MINVPLRPAVQLLSAVPAVPWSVRVVRLVQNALSVSAGPGFALRNWPGASDVNDP